VALIYTPRLVERILDFLFGDFVSGTLDCGNCWKKHLPRKADAKRARGSRTIIATVECRDWSIFLACSTPCLAKLDSSRLWSGPEKPCDVRFSLTLRRTVFHCDTALLAMAQKAKLFAGSIKKSSNKFVSLVSTGGGGSDLRTSCVVASRLESTFAEETCPKNLSSPNHQSLYLKYISLFKMWSR
jgi:hypothetical protein